MLFLHAAVHRQRYRELIAMKPLAHEEPPDLEELEWEAVSTLERECPDHPHSFEVAR
jgi:hypothetical protein